MEYKFDDKKKVLLLKGNGNVNSILKILASYDGASVFKSLKSSYKSKKDKQSKWTSSISMQTKVSDALVIVCGGTHFGSPKSTDLDKAISEIEKYGEENNCHFVFVRGQYDNPALFDGKAVSKEHVIAVQDYSIIESCSKRFLCIGGSLSYDRSWPYGDAYEDEMPKYMPELVNTNVDVIITETAPSFIEPFVDFSSQWFNTDKKLKEDAVLERHIMDQIYLHFTDGKQRIWYSTKYNYEHVTNSSWFMFYLTQEKRVYDLAVNNTCDTKDSGAYTINEPFSHSQLFDEAIRPVQIHNWAPMPEPRVIEDDFDEWLEEAGEPAQANGQGGF